MFLRANDQTRTAAFAETTLKATALLVCMVAAPNVATAATVDIFLIADHSAPDASSEITTSTVYQLGDINDRDKPTTATLVDNFTFSIGTALSFSSLHDPTDRPSPSAPDVNWLTDQDEADAGETAYTQSEIASLDNSGIPGTTVEADEQIEFGRRSELTFGGPATGFTDLILADLGGLNPFNLFLCPTADCSTTERVFNGYNSALETLLLSLDVFAPEDGVDGAEDQIWLFRFGEPIFDYVRVKENDDRLLYTGARLQADYIGGASPSATPSMVPGPATLPLLSSGVILLGWAMRRRKR